MQEQLPKAAKDGGSRAMQEQLPKAAKDGGSRAPKMNSCIFSVPPSMEAMQEQLPKADRTVERRCGIEITTPNK